MAGVALEGSEETPCGHGKYVIAHEHILGSHLLLTSRVETDQGMQRMRGSRKGACPV